MKGATAIITALNVAYDEEETRGFIKLNLLALGITAGGVMVAILAVIAITAMGSLDTLFPWVPDVVLTVGRLLSHVVMAAAGAAAAATLYRYAPNRQHARWVWLSPGSLLASLSWVIMTLGFGIYVANFGSYDATYGSLGAAVVLLTWLYLSAYVLLLGAEFNCELERQTAHDTTTGAERPLGERGAYAADTVAKGADPTPEAGPGPASAAVAEPNLDPTRVALRSELVTGRGVDRAIRMAGIGKAGLLPSVIATCGLALIGRRDRAALGIGLLTASGALKWLISARPEAQRQRREPARRRR